MNQENTKTKRKWAIAAILLLLLIILLSLFLGSSEGKPQQQAAQPEAVATLEIPDAPVPLAAEPTLAKAEPEKKPAVQTPASTPVRNISYTPAPVTKLSLDMLPDNHSLTEIQDEQTPLAAAPPTRLTLPSANTPGGTTGGGTGEGGGGGGGGGTPTTTPPAPTTPTPPTDIIPPTDPDTGETPGEPEQPEQPDGPNTNWEKTLDAANRVATSPEQKDTWGNDDYRKLMPAALHGDPASDTCLTLDSNLREQLVSMLGEQKDMSSLYIQTYFVQTGAKSKIDEQRVMPVLYASPSPTIIVNSNNWRAWMIYLPSEDTWFVSQNKTSKGDPTTMMIADFYKKTIASLTAELTETGEDAKWKPLEAAADPVLLNETVEDEKTALLPDNQIDETVVEDPSTESDKEALPDEKEALLPDNKETTTPDATEESGKQDPPALSDASDKNDKPDADTEADKEDTAGEISTESEHTAQSDDGAPVSDSAAEDVAAA